MQEKTWLKQGDFKKILNSGVGTEVSHMLRRGIEYLAPPDSRIHSIWISERNDNSRELVVLPIYEEPHICTDFHNYMTNAGIQLTSDDHILLSSQDWYGEPNEGQEILHKALRITNEFTPIPKDVILDIYNNFGIQPPEIRGLRTLKELCTEKILASKSNFLTAILGKGKEAVEQHLAETITLPKTFVMDMATKVFDREHSGLLIR